MSARTDLAAALKAALTGQRNWTVIAHAPAVSTTITTRRTLVVVFRSAIGRSTAIAGFLNTIDVWVLVGEEDTAKVEDELDKRLDVIIPVLDDARLEYSLERGLYAERWHGWHITVPIHSHTP